MDHDTEQHHQPTGSAPSVRVLTMSEAGALYNFPEDRLRRRLEAGGVPGAFKRAQNGSVEWAIPEHSLAALGYVPKVRPDPDVTAAAPAVGTGAETATAFGALSGDLREHAAERDAVAAERRDLDAARSMLDGDRQKLEASFNALDDYRKALDAEVARVHTRSQLLEERARALASDRRHLRAELKKVESLREELRAMRRRLDEEWLELRQRAPADTPKSRGERPVRRRRKPPGPPDT